MADWTDSDQQQLDQLEAREKELEAQTQGDPVANAHVEAVSKHPRPEETLPFSPVRTAIGIGRDVIEGVFDTTEALGDKLEEIAPLPMVRLGDRADNGILDVVTGQKAVEEVKNHRQMPFIPDVPGSENLGAAERITRTVGSFLIPYAGWARKFNVAKAGIGIIGRIGRGAAAGFATDFVNQPPETTNMASVLKDTFGLDDPTLNWLSYTEDDDALTQRLKAAATNIPVGILADGLFEVGAKAIRAYGAVKGEAEEARGIVEAMEHDYGVKVSKPEATPSGMEVGDVAPPVPAEEPFQSGLHVAIAEAQPKTWEDITSFLERMVDDPNLKEDELGELAKIAQGDPENALSRLGIEPSKLDWQEFDNPEGIKNLHQALINIYEKVGQRLGRTTERVTEAEIHTAARSMASDAEVLKTLFGATKNLPEILMAARMFVGAHASTLLGTAEQSLEALTKEAPNAEALWGQFLEAFHRHALYLGTVRGAGSEIGRALKSLQFLARSGDVSTAKSLAKDLAKKVPAAGKADAVEAAKADLDAVTAITDPAERIMLLSKLLEKGDDIGALAQFIRGKSGSALQRADGVARETISNLFSAGTAAYNIKSGLSMISYRALAKWMAAAARMPMALFSADQRRLARIAAMDAWAYTDGVLGAVGEAFSKTLATLEREGASELYINADNLGLKKLAKKAAEKNAEIVRSERGMANFERVDIDATPRRFALNPADRRAIEELIDSENLPQMLMRSLHFIARTAGASANAVGTLTRLGTILFINAPDKFIGTMAAKAGAQSAAIREAAARAAELGIEGPALTKYLKARVASLAADVDGWSDRAYQDGFDEVTKAAGEHEARAVLFQDQIENPGLRKLSQGLAKIRFGSFIIPFPHTPMRILERTAIDFTPLGLLKGRIRDAILHGSPQQREEAMSRLALGIFSMTLGYKLAEDRNIVGNDGSFTSTARINRESYTMRIGGDVYEFVRDDPLGTLLGFGADVKAAMDNYDPNDPEAESRISAMWEAGAWAAAANTLSKTWLESIRNLTDLAGAYTQGEFTTGLERYARNTLARRIVPGAGLQKGAQMVFDPWERQASTFQEEMLKYTLGASKLPVKRDWLGDPEPHNLGERFIGLTWKPENQEPLVKELDRLSIQGRLPDKDIKGVQLNSDQYSRLLELRGNGVQKGFGTMKEALEQLINHPAYKGLTDPAKAEQIRLVTDGYTTGAKQALLEEDPELKARVIRKVSYDQSRKGGMTPDQLKAQNEQLGRDLGLNP